ncbi:DISARM system phospholipase D-like protein DrmC [Candidatus Chloroploca sp. M-50]|uniref:DISARM system phospholipase D-like protein DrmC n=1 Tax=Candidatus Chloroploca mongolica TaxID=2528176 RepID=A0ABS4DG43_9CHLR|nr:DISARM system phospholipase D-like protein DrmC [Candidatus Chloroploca mongolica]MBP1468414.1 DISARM system phospholipase D-like protein DrmC [Candidatus Chloroploca mongolica]
MNDLLIDLPSDTRIKLIAALESGYLDLQPSVTRLRAALGRIEQAEALADALGAWHALGMSPRGAAAALRAIDRTVARQRKPDLVLSGLQIPGVFARDTRMVFAELLGSAERSVWLSSFVYVNGPKVFARLAQRMEERPELVVNLLLNIQRRWGDTTKSEHLVNAFAQTFWQQAWPGQRRPHVYYDPRSLDHDTPGDRAVLHAKAVVVDDEALFITSANLTEAASERNIEMGLLLRDRTMALTVVLYFQRLIASEHLRLLPG